MRIPFIALASILVLGCGGKEDAASKDESSGKATKGDVAKNDTTKKASKRVKLAEDKVEAVVEAWLEAQNKGDFAAYEKLYADKFNGVKRVGPKTSRYARDGWIADRKRMFKKKMVVEASDREYNLSYASAQVVFTQRWASGKYEDKGPKRLLIVKQKDDLKIAQEEMVESEVISSKNSAKGNIYFVFDGSLVLHDAELPKAHGKPKLESEDVLQTRASVKESDLSPEVLAWKGKKVRVDGVCEAEVTGFEMISRVIVHFGTEQSWNCSDGIEEYPDCEKATEDERAADAFGQGEQRLLAKLSDCDGTYAVVASSPKIVKGKKVTDEALEKKALAAFAKLEGVRNQTEVGNEDWATDPSIEIYKHPKSGQVLVTAFAQAGEGCGGFHASSWQVWEAKGDKLTPFAHGSAPIEIYDAVDSDGDGSLEFIVKGDEFGTERALVDSKTLESRVNFGYAYNDCPC